MELSLFGFTITRKEKLLKSFTLPENEDGATTVTTANGGGGGVFGLTMDNLDKKSKNDYQLINQYRALARQPEAETAIDDIVNEAISYDDTEQMVMLILDDVNLPGITPSVKDKMVKEFDDIYSMLDFQNSGYEIFRKWYIDGRLAYHHVIDTANVKGGIEKLLYIDPRKIKKIREIQKTDAKTTILNTVVDEYFLYSEEFGTTSSETKALKITDDSITYVTSGLMRDEQVISYIDKAIRPLNQLRILENASIIYKVTRAPERRIFYVDTGDLPRAAAEKFMRDVMAKYKNKTVYNSSDGTINNIKGIMTMSEDYFLPRNSSGKGTEIDTLPGGENFTDVDQLSAFLTKVYRALNVPPSRFSTDSVFNVGRSSEITRDEVKFTKFIVRLRNRFSKLFTSILEKQLVLKGILTADDWKAIVSKLKYRFSDDSHFAELKNSEVMRSRFEDASAAEEFIGTHLSRAWVDRNIFQLTKEESEEMAKEIKEEKASGRILEDFPEEGGFEDEVPEPAPAPKPKPVPAPKPAAVPKPNGQTT